jgi:hypothetical protein
MRRTIVAAFAAALLAALPALLPSLATAQGRQDFALVNRTGYQIDEVYIGPTSSTNWGRDILGSNVLGNNQVFNVRFGAATSECLWDIKVVYNDGDTSEFRRVNLCQVSKVTMFWNRSAGTTRFTVE